MKKKLLTTLLSFVAVFLLLIMPYSINVGKANVDREKRIVEYFSKENASSVVDYVRNTSIRKDNSLQIQQKLMNENSLEVKTDVLDNRKKPEAMSTDIVYPVNYVKKHPEVQATLNQEINKGKMVYLYGGLSYQEYKELLGLDNMFVRVKGNNGKSIEIDVAMELKKNSPKYHEPQKYDVIGYSLKGANSLFTNSISINNPKANVDDFHYLNEILAYVAEISNKRSATKNLSFISNNNASASTVTRDVSDTTLVLSVYYNNTELTGRAYTDWALVQTTNETLKDWDLFHIEQSYKYSTYNGWRHDQSFIKHSIYDVDDLKDGDPDSNTDSSWSIVFSAPWSFSAIFSTTNATKLTTKEYTTDPEYATYLLQSFDPDELFELYTAWKSDTTWGFLAHIQMDVEPRFYYPATSGTLFASGSTSYDVDYSYDSSTSPGY